MESKKKTLSLEDFVTLLLATLTKEPKIINLKDCDRKIVSIPSNYKQVIENILCAENGWKEEFSILIDVEQYFDDHFGWEFQLALMFEKVLQDLNKEVKYDFYMDRLLINFNQQEIDMIMNKYQDEHLKHIMEHFASLLTDYIYTRDFQEKFHDYSALAVQKMKKLNEEKMQDNVNLRNNKNKKLRLFRKR